MSSNRPVYINSERGSAILMALAAVALTGLMASATLTISSLMSTDAQRKSQAKAINHFVQSLEAIASNNLSCVGAGQGQNRISGLRFNPSNATNGQLSQNCDSNCISLGTGSGKLPVALGTVFGPDARVNQVYSDLGIKVDQIYLTDISPASGSGNFQFQFGNGNNNGGGNTASAYTAKLMVQLSSISPQISFAPREIGMMHLEFSTIGQPSLLSCNSSPSAQSLCESMSCVFNPNAPAGRQRCNCSFPEMACPAGSYISGFDPNALPNGQPICTPVQLNCSTTHGPGYFFAGIDPQGQPVCLAAEGTLGVPTPVTDGRCGPAHNSAQADANGVNSAGLCASGNANPSSVSGNAPWQWSCEGTGGGMTANNCRADLANSQVVGACGPASGRTFSDSNQATQAGLCSDGTLRSAIAGNGPWTWYCDGSNGGANAYCTAQPTQGSCEHFIWHSCRKKNGSNVAACGDGAQNGKSASNICSGNLISGGFYIGAQGVPAGIGWSLNPTLSNVPGARCVISQKFGYGDEQGSYFIYYYDGPAQPGIPGSAGNRIWPGGQPAVTTAPNACAQ